MACAYGTRRKTDSPVSIYINPVDVAAWLNGAGISWLNPVVAQMFAWPLILDFPFDDKNGL